MRSKIVTSTPEITTREATTHYAINDLLRRRWSSRAFAETPVQAETLGSLFEAARWSPSAGNGQPWSFIVADKSRDAAGFARALAVLNESNQTWVQRAPILVFAVTRRIREDGKEHSRAQYDLGLAVKSLVLQAIDLGLNVRQMAGFNADAARDLFAIPEGHDPIVAIAIGYPGAVSDLAEGLREGEGTPRQRKPLESFVFGGQFGQTYEGLKGQE
jgi:nitroreductase